MRKILFSFMTIVILVVGKKGFDIFRPTTPCFRCNIIVIVVDSLRADALPCYGYKLSTASNLCQFAKNNTLFTRAYANATWTRPNNMSIITSLYPPSHGMVDPIPNSINPAVITLPKTLEKYGYSTHFVSNDQVHMGIELGYDRMFQNIRLTGPTLDTTTLDTWLEAIDTIKKDNARYTPAFVYFHTDHVHNYVNNLLRVPNQFPLDPKYQPPNLPSPILFTDETWKFMRTYLTDLTQFYRVESIITHLRALATEANQLQTKKDAYAFFSRLPKDLQEGIYRNIAEKTYSINYFAQATALYRHLYDEQIRTFDIAISQVLERITQNGLENNTIVVVTSDHGQLLGERKLLGHIVSMGKHELYIPLIMRIPGVPQQKIHDLAQLIDIFPTVMELIGLPIPKQTRGISLAATILDKPNAAKNTFVISHTTLPHPMYSIETNRWKLIESSYPSGIHRELFDLLTDPEERVSVAPSQQKIIEILTPLLHTTLERQPIYTPVASTFPEWKTESERNERVNQD